MIKYGGIFEIDKKKEKCNVLEAKMNENGFWNDNEKATQVMRELKELKDIIEEAEGIRNDINDLMELRKLGEDETEIDKEVERLEKKVSQFELKTLLDDPDDKRGAILTIHPGAGGTESCDWAGMLLRMYKRWIEKKGYKYRELDFQPGDVAGVKDATLEIQGVYVYGYLKSEKGVHRLVRISPFDSNKRRHTSFASVFVYPLIDEDININVKEDDIKMEMFRSSGPGGQNVNKLNTAVRIVHIPTGIAVVSRSERSQYQNRQIAMRILKARLYQLEKDKQEEKMRKLEGEKTEISWGNQIRSYVLQPYQMIKDHRTNVQIGDIQSVMDGDIDIFIEAYLKWKKQTHQY